MAFYGYAQAAVISLGLNLENSLVYVCVSKVMINDARDCLNKNGLVSKGFIQMYFSVLVKELM
jgi:hypothetical protein